jgi:uncharacterized protein YgbK (DUF1537 family)
MTETKIIVIDDDPTGSQTVHSCLLLTRWDPQTLAQALQDDSPLFFVLSNTRGMDSQRAAAVTRETCHNLKHSLGLLRKQGRGINPILVSRSDSTLRGHYPVETDVIAEELGPFDAHFMIPAFFEAGRITRDATHYLVVGGREVPTHETEFARDSVFGYSTSYLPDYVQEKTRGRIQAAEVKRFLLEDVRGDCRDRLRRLSGNVCCTVDGERQSDLDSFAAQVQEVAREGRRFLFRSAASLLTSLAKLPPQPVPAEEMAAYVRDGRPGAIVVGSHVQKTSEQVDHLLVHGGVTPVHVDVGRLDSDSDKLRTEVLRQVEDAHEGGLSVVIYTSRKERLFDDQAARLAFGERVSAFLMDIVANLPPTIGFLISKGGITSNDVLSTGLALRASRVLGQILTGCSVVRCPSNHPRYPNLAVVIFPGNVGDRSSLTRAYQILSGGSLAGNEREIA